MTKKPEPGIEQGIGAGMEQGINGMTYPRTEPGAETDTKIKMETVAEIKVYNKSGKVVEHFKIDQNGDIEQLGDQTK